MLHQLLRRVTIEASSEQYLLKRTLLSSNSNLFGLNRKWLLLLI